MMRAASGLGTSWPSIPARPGSSRKASKPPGQLPPAACSTTQVASSKPRWRFLIATWRRTLPGTPRLRPFLCAHQLTRRLLKE